MRTFLMLVVAVVVAGCTPMKTIKTSSFVFLTPAGSTIAIARPSAEVLPAVEQLFSDKGFAVYDRKAVSETNTVLFLKGTRERINRRNRPDRYGNKPTAYDAYGMPMYGAANAGQPGTQPANAPPASGATSTSTTRQPGDDVQKSASMQEQNYASRDVGSWFSVRAVTVEGKTVLTFYGKPTIYGGEGCGQGDSDLRDTGYACRELTMRADWPGHQLVEGREETQVISTIIAVLGERWPLQ